MRKNADGDLGHVRGATTGKARVLGSDFDENKRITTLLVTFKGHDRPHSLSVSVCVPSSNRRECTAGAKNACVWSLLGIAQAGDRARVHCGERVRVSEARHVLAVVCVRRGVHCVAAAFVCAHGTEN